MFIFVPTKQIENMKLSTKFICEIIADKSREIDVTTPELLSSKWYDSYQEGNYYEVKEVLDVNGYSLSLRIEFSIMYNTKIMGNEQDEQQYLNIKIIQKELSNVSIVNERNEIVYKYSQSELAEMSNDILDTIIENYIN